MCTRDELNTLIRELLRRINQVALLGAKIQFEEELKLNKPAEYLTCSENTKNYVKNNAQNARFNQVARFHMAYLKYFVFASDPYAEIIVPLSSSSLALFITNIMSKMSPTSQQTPSNHTSKTIIDFLQIIDAPEWQTHYIKYRRELLCIMKELNVPYDIEILTKIRHEAFRKNLDLQRRGVPMRVPVIQRTVSSSQKTQIIQLADTATATNSFPASVHTMHQVQPMRMATVEQQSYVGQQQTQQHILQMQSATTTMETLYATSVGDMEMQIPTITSTVMAGQLTPNETHSCQVYATNGQSIIDPTMPVYWITSNEPIRVEVSSSDDVNEYIIDTDHTLTTFNCDHFE